MFTGFNERNRRENKLKTKEKIEKQCKQNHALLPKLPLKLTVKKPKPPNYPKQIVMVGDEIRAARLDKKLTQHEVGEMLNGNKNFVSELELNQKPLSIYALNKAYSFLVIFLKF